jgi:hypothetical protein
VIVQESACRVHLAADRLEVMKARIERGMSSARLNCSLPNRSRSALPENRVDIEEAETVTLLRLPFVFVTYWNSSIITIMRITFVAQSSDIDDARGPASGLQEHKSAASAPRGAAVASSMVMLLRSLLSFRIARAGRRSSHPPRWEGEAARMGS